MSKCKVQEFIETWQAGEQFKPKDNCIVSSEMEIQGAAINFVEAVPASGRELAFAPRVKIRMGRYRQAIEDGRLRFGIYWPNLQELKPEELIAHIYRGRELVSGKIEKLRSDEALALDQRPGTRPAKGTITGECDKFVSPKDETDGVWWAKVIVDGEEMAMPVGFHGGHDIDKRSVEPIEVVVTPYVLDGRRVCVSSADADNFLSRARLFVITDLMEEVVDVAPAQVEAQATEVSSPTVKARTRRLDYISQLIGWEVMVADNNGFFLLPDLYCDTGREDRVFVTQYCTVQGKKRICIGSMSLTKWNDAVQGLKDQDIIEKI